MMPDQINTLITVLTPVIVYLVTKAVTAIGPSLSSLTITTVVVPVLSVLVTFIAPLVGGTNPWYVTLILGLVSTFVHEFISNLQNKNQAPPAAPAAAK